MKVTVVARSGPGPLGDVDLHGLLDALASAPPAAPYDEPARALCGRVATRLLEDPRSRLHPELMALGFFARPAELARMHREFVATARPEIVRVPHGLVFHVPPANVDTVFVYAWLLATLAGNPSIVRMSRRTSPVVELVVSVLAELLASAGPAVAPSAFVRYDHDAAITAAISARSALRMIWGGDATVAAIRAAPLPPTSRDLTFADRWSMAAIGAGAVDALDPAGLRALAEAMATDLYEFDQRGCSSPRLVLWLGAPELRARARARLWPALAEAAVARGFRPEPSVRLARETFVHRAILDGPVVGREDHGPALTVLVVDSLEGVTRDHPGGGLVFDAGSSSLAALDPWIVRKDQTLSHFGLSREELVALAVRLGGRGLDRLVPIGRALALATIWDGYDLAAELVRNVHVVGG